MRPGYHQPQKQFSGYTLVAPIRDEGQLSIISEHHICWDFIWFFRDRPSHLSSLLTSYGSLYMHIFSKRSGLYNYIFLIFFSLLYFVLNTYTTITPSPALLYFQCCLTELGSDKNG